MFDPARLEAVAEHLRKADRILFITGAGISADSGLPTYRGVGGLYNQRLTEDDIPIEMALSGIVFRRYPEITWKYLLQIERACRSARFNRGHEVIAQIEKRKPGTWVLCQNIDGFHRAAGSQNVIEIHGRLYDLYCTECGYSFSVPDYGALTTPPQCPQCNGWIRPDVVLFGETLPPRAITQLYQELERGFDLVFSIGTTSVFPYIALPVQLAKQRGVTTVEINPAQTEVSDVVDIKFADSAARTLSALWEHFAK